MLIPCIIPAEAQEIEINSLIDIGFCYAPLQAEVLTNLQTCMRGAQEFFQKDTAEKLKWQLKAPGDPERRIKQGYALRTQANNDHPFEQFFFKPETPYGPFIAYVAEIKRIHHAYLKEILLPIMAAVFQKVSLSQNNFFEASYQPHCRLVFQRYLPVSQDKGAIRFNAHKDFGLITAVFFEAPGLEVFYQNTWHPIAPKPGHIVVNLGNAIEQITGYRCHSALHRVTNITYDRTSMIYFVNPNYQRPMKNYLTQERIASTGEEFCRQQFIKLYQFDQQ